MDANRRTMLSAGVVFAAAATPVLAMAQPSSQMRQAAMMPMPDTSGVRTAKEFSMNVIGPAEFSLATSKLAVGRATQQFAHEFAGFELTEAVAVTTVLKELGTPVPAMTPKFQAILDIIREAPTGPKFDQAYIDAQYHNHVFLRDLAMNYLRNSSPDTTNMMELQGRHLATLALATFKEHTILTQQIANELHS